MHSVSNTWLLRAYSANAHKAASHAAVANRQVEMLKAETRSE